MTHLLALDPGGTTGYSLWTYDSLTPLTLLEHGQIPGGLLGFSLWAREYRSAHWIDQVVSEDFVDDDRTDSPEVVSLRIEGAIVALLQIEGASVVWQRNTAKAAADDLFLKRHGFWFKGQEHARDSARHAIHYMKARRHMPTIERFWPRRSREAAMAS